MAHLITLLLLLVPAAALANGGGPLLLIVNGLAFVYGSVAIVIAEWGIYYWLARVPAKDAFFDALMVNLYSTVVVGLAFPAVIAVVGGLGSMLPGTIGQVFSAMGTWIYDGMAYPALTFGFTFFWLIVTFLLTVRFEEAVLGKRWRARAATFSLSAKALSWRSNAVTYGALFVFFLAAFGSGFIS